MKVSKIILLSAVCALWIVGCGQSGKNQIPFSGSVQENSKSPGQEADSPVEPEKKEAGLPAESERQEADAEWYRVEAYINQVENYMEGSFHDMEAEETKELSQLLQGHYDVVGRSDGENRSYYIAMRRADAPVYENLDRLDISWVSGADTENADLGIGYCDENGKSTLLYQVAGYNLTELPFPEEPLSGFCFTKEGSGDDGEVAAFHLAFSDSGRKQLQFIKDHPQLALREDGEPGIEFYYHDRETMQYCSEPWRYFIPLTEREQEEFEELVSGAAVEDMAVTNGEARKYLKKNGLYTTGAYLYLPDAVYQLFGNWEQPGAFLRIPGTEAYVSMGDPVSIVHSEELWKRIIGRLQSSVEMDYGNFDKDWFDVPLTSASIQFPERIMDGEYGYDIDLRYQIVEDEEKLAELSRLMDRAFDQGEIYGFSACPYDAELLVTRKDGETRRICIATDSCDSMAWEGRMSFEYGSQGELAKIFDVAMRERLESESSE